MIKGGRKEAVEVDQVQVHGDGWHMYMGFVKCKKKNGTLKSHLWFGTFYFNTGTLDKC